MPSKTLLYAAEVLHLAQNRKRFGLKIPRATADLRAMHARKKKIIAEFAPPSGDATARLGALRSLTFTARTPASSMRTPWSSPTAHALRADKIFSSPPARASALHPSRPCATCHAGPATMCSTSISCLESVIVLGGGIVACELAQLSPAHRLARHPPSAQPEHSPRPFARGQRRRTAGLSRRRHRDLCQDENPKTHVRPPRRHRGEVRARRQNLRSPGASPFQRPRP